MISTGVQTVTTTATAPSLPIAPMTKKAKAEAEAAATQAAKGAANGGTEAIEEDTSMGAIKEEDGGKYY
ncbi:hypothetical protein EG327_006656 [Venturia inaequalis]|uniref:Uncharacterized protein n=1 Tax=Venturia inaequalis TaxID=5025 RepID=A0A8H3V4M3_VENIN|nr:hypothetical protein EG327_006656 [Venturia inaequalis]